MSNVTSLSGTWENHLSAETFALSPEMERLRVEEHIDFHNLEMLCLDETQFERAMRDLTIAVLNSVPSHYHHYVQDAANSAVELVNRLKYDDVSMSLATHQALYLASVAQWFEFFTTRMPEVRVAIASQRTYEILSRHGSDFGMQYAVAHLIHVGHLITGKWLRNPETRLELAHCVGLLTPLVSSEETWSRFARMRYTLTPRIMDTPIADDEYDHTRSVQDLLHLASLFEFLPAGTYHQSTRLTRHIPDLIDQISA